MKRVLVKAFGYGTYQAIRDGYLKAQRDGNFIEIVYTGKEMKDMTPWLAGQELRDANWLNRFLILKSSFYYSNKELVPFVISMIVASILTYIVFHG